MLDINLRQEVACVGKTAYLAALLSYLLMHSLDVVVQFEVPLGLLSAHLAVFSAIRWLRPRCLSLIVGLVGILLLLVQFIVQSVAWVTWKDKFHLTENR